MLYVMSSRINNFYDLEVWQNAYDLTLKIYQLTKDFPRDEMFGLTSQLRRSASSIMANIAEGFARFHYKDKIKFYFQARASATEVQSHLLLARGLNYITKEACDDLISQIDSEGRLINGLINSIKTNGNITF